MEFSLRTISNSKNVCRSCLASDQNLVKLDSTIDDAVKISDCLITYLNVEVHKEDGLPFTICLRCLDELLLIRKFHLRYFKSVAYLLDCYKKLKVEYSLNDETISTNDEETENINYDEDTITESIWMSRATTKTRTKHPATDSNPSDSTIKIETLQDDELNLSEDETTGEASQIEFIEIESDSPHFSVDTKETVSHAPETEKLKSQLSTTVACLQCRQPFPTRILMRDHFNAVHSEENARRLCMRCQKTFPTRAQLLGHLYMHQRIRIRRKNPLTVDTAPVKKRTYTRNRPCEICHKVFSSNSDLVVHLRVHTGERPYSCPICERAFNQMAILKTHMAQHTGKTVPCPKCDKKFSRHSFLKVHMRVHDDIRPYACNMCDKKYRMSGHLKAHLFSHRDKRDYVCEKCGKDFRDPINLQNHLNIHTKRYKCSICKNYRARDKHRLRCHLDKIHKIHDDPHLYIIDEEMIEKK